MESFMAVLLGLGFLMFLLSAASLRGSRRRGKLRSPARLDFVPAERADEQAARRASWLTGRYKGGLTPKEWREGRHHLTQRGERVRSRPEVLIADHLHARGLHYEYEPKVCGFRPDFYLPDHGIVIEYWGTHPRGHPYRRTKTRAYLQAGYRLVSLEPGKEVGLETDLRRQLYYKMQE